MAKNIYPADCQRLINQFVPGAAAWADAAGVSLDDVRQVIAIAWLTGEDPRAAVPAALGIRKLRDDGLGGVWAPRDRTVWRAELNDEVSNDERLLPLRDQRGSLTYEIANDAGIGLRAAQKRLKKARERGQQGDLFGGAL